LPVKPPDDNGFVPLLRHTQAAYCFDLSSHYASTPVAGSCHVAVTQDRTEELLIDE
jgi:hypothetical protein